MKHSGLNLQISIHDFASDDELFVIDQSLPIYQCIRRYTIDFWSRISLPCVMKELKTIAIPASGWTFETRFSSDPG